jgi:hypothetical protein
MFQSHSQHKLTYLNLADKKPHDTRGFYQKDGARVHMENKNE